MNFKEMFSDLQSRLGDIGQVQYTTAELKQWLNAGQQDVANRLDNITSRWFGATAEIDTEMGKDEYDLPTDARRIRAVAYKTEAEGPLAQCMAMDIINRGATLNNAFYTPSATQPFWYQWGNKLGVLPVPTGAVTKGIKVWYFKRLPLLTGDTDESEIPLEYQNLIVLRAHIIAAPKFGQDPTMLANMYNAEFEAIRAIWTSNIEIELAGQKKLGGIGA